MFQRESSPAFTLIELLVVISIIGILSTLSVVALNNARSKSRDARRLSDIKQINLALELYHNETGIYPSASGTLDANITGLCLSDIGISSTCGTLVYLQKIPGDPLNDRDYQYRQLSSGLSYRLFAQLENDIPEYPSGSISMGPNGHSPDLLAANGIDWRDPANWKCGNYPVSWDDDLQAIKIVDYHSCNFYPSSGYLPIDTSKKYYIEAEYMTTGATSYGFYLGTISYNESKVRLLGHPGSYDYFGAVGAKPTSTGIWNLVMNKGGQPRTGESATTSLHYRWHPGAAFARIYIAANYNGPQTTYIRNIRFYVE